MWISSKYTYILSWSSLPTLPMLCSPLGHHRVLHWVSCAMEQFLISNLITHGCVRMSVVLFQFFPPSPFLWAYYVKDRGAWYAAVHGLAESQTCDWITATPPSTVSRNSFSMSASLFLPWNRFISTIFLDSVYMC